jgi:hypothetical protein
MANRIGTTIANAFPNNLILGIQEELFRPIDWNAL